MLKYVAAKTNVSKKFFEGNGAFISIALMAGVFAVVWVGLFEPFFRW